MSRRNYSNTAVETSLSADITSGDTSLVVVSADGFPTAPFTIRCESEIILVGAKSGTTFSSLTRGFDGTSAVAHSAPSIVEHRAIRDDFSYRWIDPVSDKTSTNSFTDHFDGDSLDPAWTQVTPTGTVTWTESRDVLSVKFANQTASDCVGLVKTIGALSYPLVITTAVRFLGVPNYVMAGPLFSNGTTTASTIIWAMPYQDNNWGFLSSLRTGTFTNVSSIPVTERRAVLRGGWLYIRLIWRATDTWSLEYSPDGVSYTDWGEGNEAFSMTPTHFGLGVSTWGNPLDAIASFEFFDVTDVLP